MADNTNSMNSMLCKSNCGFFGNASCDGFCSKCYKDHVKRQNSGSAAGRVTPTTGSSSSSSSTSSNLSSVAAVAAVASAALTQATLSQMNSINEIPNEMAVDSSLPSAEKTEQQATSTNSSQMLPPPVSFTVGSDDMDTRITTPSKSNVTSSMPIPIPSKQSATSSLKPHAIGQHETISAPVDLCSTSMTSVSSPGTNNNSLLATSIGSEMCSSINDKSTNNISSSSSMSSSGTPGKKKLTRCVLESCKRKVGLTGFDCRCGGLYCWEHRYSDKHNCKFDYKELGQDQIRKNNPIVVGEKIKKI